MTAPAAANFYLAQHLLEMEGKANGSPRCERVRGYCS